MTEPVDDASTEARWQSAAVVAIANRTPRIKSFVLAPQAPFHFHSGQHVDLRLTAESAGGRRNLIDTVLVHREGPARPGADARQPAEQAAHG